MSKAHGRLVIGKAPDGLDIQFARHPSSPSQMAYLLREAAWEIGIQGMWPELEGTPLAPLAAELELILQTPPVISGLGNDHNRGQEFLILPRPIEEIAGRSLLQRLLNYRRWPTNKTIIAPLQRQSGLFLGSCIETGQMIVCRRDTTASSQWPPAYRFLRDFKREFIGRIPGARMVAGDRPAGRPEQPYDADQYRTLLHASLEDSAIRPGIRVSRNVVAGIIRQAANQLAKLHSEGLIHGDMKPDHIIIAEESVELIDSGDLTNGATDYGVTPDWAAPEQLLDLPISFQADQYPIGLMLLTLVAGKMDAPVLNGWSPRLQFPFSVTYNAAIGLNEAVVPRCAGRWTDLIERCLKFNAAERFASTDELVDELSALCDENSLQGDLIMDIDFGRLDVGPDTDGVIKPHWAVDPRRVPFDRSD